MFPCIAARDVSGLVVVVISEKHRG